MKYCIEDFEDNTGIDITNNKKAIRRLKSYCENAIINISSFQNATIYIDCWNKMKI